MGAYLGDDRFGDLALVKRVGPLLRDQPQDGAIIGVDDPVALGWGFGLRLQIERPTGWRLVQHGDGAVHSECAFIRDRIADLGQLDRRGEQFGHRQLAIAGMHLCKTAQGSRRCHRAVADLIVLTLDPDHILTLDGVGGIELITRGGRRDTEKIDRIGTSTSGVMNDHEATGADAAVQGFDHAQHMGGRDRRVYGVAANLHDPDRRVGAGYVGGGGGADRRYGGLVSGPASVGHRFLPDNHSASY